MTKAEAESDATVQSLIPTTDQFADLRADCRQQLAAMVSICNMLERFNTRLNAIEAQLKNRTKR